MHSVIDTWQSDIQSVRNIFSNGERKRLIGSLITWVPTCLLLVGRGHGCIKLDSQLYVKIS